MCTLKTFPECFIENCVQFSITTQKEEYCTKGELFSAVRLYGRNCHYPKGYREGRKFWTDFLTLTKVARWSNRCRL